MASAATLAYPGVVKAMQIQDTLEAVSRLAAEAGRIIMPFFKNDCAHHLKPDLSPVTEADVASHGFLVKALGELNPGLPVISEESFGVEAPNLLVGDYWLIDPLDGTKEFLKGRPQFTVNIAMMHDHRPILGVVHAPVFGLTYRAADGKGGWRQQGQNPPAAIRTRAADTHRLTVVASKDHSGPRVKRLLSKLPSPVVTNIGSSLKFCLIAEGQTDLYFRDLPTMEWDTAAAQCVVEAAGGVVRDLNGEPLRYGKPGLKNPGFVVMGDPNFPWNDFVPGKENQDAFRAFFAAVCGDTGEGARATPAQ